MIEDGHLLFGKIEHNRSETNTSCATSASRMAFHRTSPKNKLKYIVDRDASLLIPSRTSSSFKNHSKQSPSNTSSYTSQTWS